MTTAADLKLKFHDGGFGICINGPRYSTKAESLVFRSWGAKIINMTMVPEVRSVPSMLDIIVAAVVTVSPVVSVPSLVLVLSCQRTWYSICNDGLNY